MKSSRALHVPDEMEGVKADHVATMEFRGLIRVQAKLRQTCEQFLIQDLQLYARKVRAQTAMRAGTECNVHFDRNRKPTRPERESA